MSEQQWEDATEDSSTTVKEKCSYFAKFAWFFKVVELKLKVANAMQPLVIFAIRFHMAIIFWKSGVLKLPQGFLGIGEGNWETTLMLFEYEHPVPGLSPQIAAYLGTTFEILCPVLLVFGFGTRIAGFIIFCMVAVMEFTYQHASDHINWMFFSAVLVFFGGGKLSVDYLIKNASRNCKEYKRLVLDK